MVGKLESRIMDTKKNIWIIANWKSNKNIREALEWIAQVGPELPRNENLKVVVCPTFVNIEEIKKSVLVGNFPIMVGSQDLSPYPEGSFTGEEAASILKQFVSLAILGHSERRQNFAETDQMVEAKVNQATDHQIIPLVCVQGPDTPVPAGCSLVAYEPIFAIGTGDADTPQGAAAVAASLKNKYGEDLQVLYGGSVTADNCQGFLDQDNISGLLIGQASLDAVEFIKIVEASFKK